MAEIDLDKLKYFFAEFIPFNKHLGLHLETLERGRAVITLDMRPEFIGDPMKQIMHGGVMATMLDVTGGITGFSMLDWPRETSLNTIDMRVDYVRMGKGERFVCEGSIIRKGNRIVVTRSDLKNDKGDLVAFGTAAYNIFSNPEEVPKNILEAAEHMFGK